MIVLLGVVVLPLLAFGTTLLWHVTTRHDSVTVTRAQLRWRANYENWLVQRGDPRGIYGRFPPYM